MKKLHILWGDSPNGALQKVLASRSNNEVNDTLSFYDSLSVGPMSFGENWETGFKKREAFWQELSQSEDDFFTDTYDFLHYPFSDYDELILWHADTAGDWMMVYLFTARLAELNLHLPLYHMFEARAPVPPKFGYEAGRFGLEILNPQELTKRFSKIKLVSEKDYQHWLAEWQRLCVSNAQVRVVIDNTQVSEQSEDFYDELIFSQCKNEFQKCARVIGGAIVNSLHPVGDVFLAYRVRQLVAQGKLISDNSDMSAIRSYSVRLP